MRGFRAQNCQYTQNKNGGAYTITHNNTHKMKRFFWGFILGSCLTVILAFNTNRYEPNQSSAEVSKIEGFYIFTDSKPIMAYDTIGDVYLGFVSGTQYETIRTNLIKRARKKYPTADGIILNLNKKRLDKCVAIKFK